jgi:hypothetical protein
MKTILSGAALIMLAALTSVAQASGVNGRVTYPTVLATGVVLVVPDAVPGNKPACNTQSRYAFDGTTAAGKQLTALILTAFAMGRTVTFVGTGSCTVWGDSEDLSYATINLS